MRAICGVASCAPRCAYVEYAHSGARRLLAADPPGHRIPRPGFRPHRSRSVLHHHRGTYPGPAVDLLKRPVEDVDAAMAGVGAVLGAGTVRAVRLPARAVHERAVADELHRVVDPRGRVVEGAALWPWRHHVVDGRLVEDAEGAAAGRQRRPAGGDGSPQERAALVVGHEL